MAPTDCDLCPQHDVITAKLAEQTQDRKNDRHAIANLSTQVALTGQQMSQLTLDFTNLQQVVRDQMQLAQSALTEVRSKLETHIEWVIIAKDTALRVEERLAKEVVLRMDEISGKFLVVERRLVHIETMAETRASLSERVTILEAKAIQAEGIAKGVKWLWMMLIAVAGACGVIVHHFLDQAAK